MNTETLNHNEQASNPDSSPWGEAFSKDLPPFNPEQSQLSHAEKVVTEAKQNFTNITTRNQQYVEKTKNRIEQLQQKQAAEPDEWRAERYAQQIRDNERILRTQEAWVEFARIPTTEDVEERAWAKQEFANAIKNTVPDELPLVFHGNNNLGQIHQIIRTHGLKTPDQRGESATSFATQVDVTAKTNIQTSCDFAESNFPWLPYGAIFAFMPKPEEIAEVQKTGDSSEVFGGVDGVDFQEEPERLYGIITTSENLERLQNWCEEAGLDQNKVLTHQNFLKQMRELSQTSKN